MHGYTIYFFIYVQIVSVLCKDVPSLCPSYSKKCNCYESLKKIKVECKKVNEFYKLHDAFNKDLNSTTIHLFKLNKCTAKTIQSATFKFANVSIQNILSDCPFNPLDDDAMLPIRGLKELHLHKTQFTRIPKAISGLVHLQLLEIYNSKIEELEIHNMESLEKLILKRNRIRIVLKNSIVGCLNIRSIDLSDNNLIYIEPGAFHPCQNLTELLLHGNQINSTLGIFGNSKLQEVNLRRNDVKSFEIVSHEEISLEKLDLGENPTLEVTDQSFNPYLIHLKTLIMDRCKLKTLPPLLFRSLHELNVVDLSNNKLEDIPSGLFHGLTKLVDVNLNNNRIRNMNEAFLRNDGLLRIFLFRNLIEACGDIFQNTPFVETVDMQDNRLQYITNKDFSKTPFLTNLKLNKNNISGIDSDAFIHLKQIQILTLEANMLESLNGSVRDLPNLRNLHLLHNRLKEIREYELHNLPRLKELLLGKNSLVSVEGAFSKLVKLSDLELNGNRLETISRSTFPEEIKVKYISLSGNKWSCDCRLSWLREWLITQKPKGLKNSFQCAKPKVYRSKSLLQLTHLNISVSPNTCNSTCVSAFYVRVDCSNRGLSYIPTVLPTEVGELLLQNNSLTNPISLNISLTHLRMLNLERNFIEEIDFHFPQTLNTLKLAWNNFTRFNYFSLGITNWTLSNNPWICDCDTVPFWKWLTTQNGTILDLDLIRCSLNHGLEATRGKIMIELDETELCPPTHTILYASLAAALVVTASLAISIHLAYSRYHYHLKVWLYSKGFKWLKKNDGVDKGWIYDAYLAFSDEDLLFVRRCILPELEEKEPYYSVFVPQRDSVGGEFKVNAEISNVMKSKRMIVLLSQNYTNDEFCMEMFRVAYASCLEEREFRIIPVLLESLPPSSELDPALKVTLESSRCPRFGRRLFWQMVRFAMPDKGKDHVTEAEASRRKGRKTLPNMAESHT